MSDSLKILSPDELGWITHLTATQRKLIREVISKNLLRQKVGTKKITVEIIPEESSVYLVHIYEYYALASRQFDARPESQKPKWHYEGKARVKYETSNKEAEVRIQENAQNEVRESTSEAESSNSPQRLQGKEEIIAAIQSLELIGQNTEANKLRLLLFVIDLFESGDKFMRAQVDEEAKRLGFEELGFVDHKLVKEIIEFAIVLHAREKDFEEIVVIYNQQATLSIRTSESQALNQFSTSLPIAWILGKFCGLDKPGEYFEPSAGNGMLTVYGNPANFTVNDIDKDRLWSLRKQGYKSVLSQDATLPFDLPKFDAVITNPPFGGKVKGRLFNGVIQEKLDYLMAANALEHLKDSGRAAIITGGHISYKNNMVDGLQDWYFFVYLASNFNVVDIININSQKLYYKMGTTWPIKIVLIDGFGYRPDKKEIEKVANPIIRNWIALSSGSQTDKFSIEPVSSFEALNSRVNGH